MDSAERAKELWEALMVWAKGACESSEKQVSLQMGRSKDFVGSCKRRRKGGATLEETFALAAATGLPDWLVFGRLLPVPEAPAELLRRLWVHLKPGRKSEERPAVVTQVRKVCAALESKEIKDSAKPAMSARRRLGWIDELRQGDRAAGIRHLEGELSYLLVALSGAKTPEPCLVGDVAYAVALWSDSQRGEGRLDLALEACPLAIELAERSGERWVIGHCLWLAALLVQDLGYPEYGLPWLDRAATLFSLENHQGHVYELLATHGILSLAAGRRERAVAALREALGRLPASDRRWRHPALLHLAIAAQESGNGQEALSCLEVLTSECRESENFLGLLHCRKAAAYLQVGAISEGVSCFSKAMRLLARSGKRVEIAYALCDFTEYLVAEEQAAPATAVAAEVLVLLGDDPENPELAQIVEDFFAITRLRPLVKADIDRTRSQLETLSPPPQPSDAARAWLCRQRPSGPPFKASSEGAGKLGADQPRYCAPSLTP